MAQITATAPLTACCVWLTGPPGAGKRTIAQGLAREMRARGSQAVLLDEETAASRLAGGAESLAWLCRLLVTHGVPVIVSVPLPARRDRDDMRYLIPGFVEVFVDRSQHDESYEEPFAPELRIPTHDRAASASVAQLLSWLEHTGYVTEY